MSKQLTEDEKTMVRWVALAFSIFFSLLLFNAILFDYLIGLAWNLTLAIGLYTIGILFGSWRLADIFIPKAERLRDAESRTKSQERNS